MIDPVEPDKVVNYPIKNDEKGGALHLYGNPNASLIAICCAGFPDDHSIFQPFASRLAKESSCLVGVTCIPGYDDRPDKPWTSHPPEGYTIQDMTSNVAEAVKALKQESTCKDAKLTGIFHDWGSIPGAIWSNQVLEEDDGSSKLDRLVYFDVLPEPRKDNADLPEAPPRTLFEFLARWLYFGIFAFSSVLHLYVAHVIALIFFGISISVLKIVGLICTREIDDKTTKDSPVVKNLRRLFMMLYPYRVFLFGGFNDLFAEFFVLPRDLKTTPVLYMYGLDKNCQFHDNRAVKLLEREEDEGQSISKAIPVENAGHYLYTQQPDICLEAVLTFMNEKKA